jgi:DNA-binding LacI/PurR family transcriptional regulator
VTSPRGVGKVTLTTVAEAVGVSPTTVSNAYNRPRKLSPALRERILAAARELGYPGPHPAARSLRRGRAGSIGLLFGEALTYVFQSPGAVEFLHGLAEGSARHNSALQIIAALDAQEQDGAASLLANAIVDGLVVWSLPDRHPLLRLARERGIPLVIHGGPRADGIPFVGIDDRAAAEAVAEHLLQLGHRSLAVVSHPFGPARRARRRDTASLGRPAYRVTRGRLTGYKAAADAAPKLATLDVYEVAVSSRDEGHRAGLALLQATPRPTAVLAMSDELALGVLAAAGELGLRVPGDVSLAGWDDSPAGRVSDPPLTTIRQSLHDQGRTCAQLLIDATRGELAATDLVHLEPWQLVTRESTRPPQPSKPLRRR